MDTFSPSQGGGGQSDTLIATVALFDYKTCGNTDCGVRDFTVCTKFHRLGAAQEQFLSFVF